VDRISDKDAADIYRIMLAVPIADFIRRLTPMLQNQASQVPTRAALVFMAELFGARASQRVLMASEALRAGVPAERVAAVCTSFSLQLRDQRADD
jgi:hypothetical protein